MATSKPTLVSESLAVKYRPGRIEEMIGNEHIVTQVQGMLKQGRFPNAVLLSGGFGMGKTTLARILARYANCATHDICGECASCKYENLDTHPDFKEINFASERGIDDIRALATQSRAMPRFNLRVFMCDEAHALTGNAAEAFLKTLEEPPKRTFFILATNHPEKVKDTLRSRCQKLELKAPTEDQMLKYLRRICKREGVTVLEEHIEVLREICKLSLGHTRNAVQMLESFIAAVNSESDVSLKTVLQDYISGSEGAIETAAGQLVGHVFGGSARDIVALMYANKDNARPLLYKMRWCIDYLLNTWAGVWSKGFNPPINKAFSEAYAKSRKEKAPGPMALTMFTNALSNVEVQLNSIPGLDERTILQAALLDQCYRNKSS